MTGPKNSGPKNSGPKNSGLATAGAQIIAVGSRLDRRGLAPATAGTYSVRT